MSRPIPGSPFETALGLTIHDVKNSLASVLDRIEAIDAESAGEEKRYSGFRYEIKRINNNLVRLLSLYKLGPAGYGLQADDNHVGELLEDLAIDYRALLEAKGISLEFDCPEGLWGWFDRGLLYSVIDNAINNSIRYTRSVISVTAEKEGGWLVLRVSDDGDGYPEKMLQQEDNEGNAIPTDYGSGSTGLGIYFSRIVAGLHRCETRQGHVKLGNHENLGGGCFSIYLPIGS